MKVLIVITSSSADNNGTTHIIKSYKWLISDVQDSRNTDGGTEEKYTTVLRTLTFAHDMRQKQKSLLKSEN